MADDDEFDAQYDFYQKIAERNELTHSTWSIYEVTDFEAIPFPKATKLRHSEHWGEGVIELDLPTNATWLDLWKAADRLIYESKDNAHIYIEVFFEVDESTLLLIAGS